MKEMKGRRVLSRQFRQQLQWLRVLLFIVLVAVLQSVQADTPSSKPALVNLGDGQFQLGEIHIDKTERTFSVAGSVIRDHDQVLLEYFAVKKDGMKAYEAVVDLNTTANEFNVACILIGLDASRAVLPKFHFDKQPVEGDLVDVLIQWEVEGDIKRIRAEELFLVDGKRVEDREWVYTGSVILPDKRYLAEEAGTLIGFIHDQDSIIEHQKGIGLKQLDKLTVDRSLLPPTGTSIQLTVRNATSRK